jgi:crotonobetaine/carnitine-CoA ligase
MNRLDLSDRDDRLLHRVLRLQADQVGDDVFIMSGDRRLTFADVDARADELAAGLRALGVSRGDTVAVLMESCPEFVLLSFAVNRLGAVWVATNVDFKGEWLRGSLHDSRARVLVVDAGLLARVVELGDGLPFEHIVVRDGAGGLDLTGPGAGSGTSGPGPVAGREAPAPVAGREHGHYGDTAAVLWTSGTTGRSKGVMQSHNAWLRGAESGANTSGAREGDVLYCCLPMHNSAAWVAIVYRALVCGLPFGLDPRFSVADFWDRVRFYGATQTFTLGAMHVFLWQQPERPDDAANPVRVASCVPMPEALLEPFKRRFAIEQIYQGYGQSEVLGLLSRVDDGRRRWSANTAGVPLPGIDVRLLDDDDREVGVGEVGEICVRPTEPYVLFNGYFNDAEATLRASRNLWYHTGDLGRRNDEGEYFFFDRKADYIRYKGRSVSSFAVEAVVTAHPAVVECAAYGVTSAELESEAEIKVDVVVRPGACVEPDELARFVNDRAPYFLVPRYIELVAELPHTPTGRVQKYVARRRGVTDATWDRDAVGFAVHR